MDSREILLAKIEKYQGNWEEIYNSVQSKEDLNTDEGITLRDELLAKCQKSGIKIATIMDPEFPQVLMKGVTPPFAIFYKGDVSLLSDPEPVLITGYGQTISDFGKRATIKVVMDRFNISDGQHLVVTGDLSAVELVAQKAARTVPKAMTAVPTSWKTAMVSSTALDMAGARQTLLDNVVLDYGVVLTTVPPGCNKSINSTRLAAQLCPKYVIIVELGDKPAKDFLNEMGISRQMRSTKFAVAHDITEKEQDKCNELIAAADGFEPYFGKIRLG